MTKEVQKEKKKTLTIGDYLDRYKGHIAQCLPRHVSIDRVTRVALSEIRRTPAIAKCKPESLMKAVMQASSLGLELGNNLGHAYLVPYKDEVTLIIGYKGLIDLARRSGQILSIAAHEVYENDEFEFEYGLNESIRHVPARTNRGQLIAFYAYAKLKDGGYQMEVMWKEQVDAIKASSKAAQSSYSPWNTHYVEMGRKTLIRRIAKYLPMSVEMQQAASLDEKNEAGIEDDFIDLPTSEYSENETKSDRLAEAL